MAKIETVKLSDEFDTEIRTLVYRGAEIRVSTWKTLGYRLKRKNAVVKLSDGSFRAIHTANYDPRSLSAMLSNEEIFSKGRDLIRDWEKARRVG